MGKIKYLLQRMRRMDYRAMWKTARMLHEKTGRATLGLLLDMGRCAFQYGAGYMDYKIAEMYRLTPAQRATQITRAASNRIVARMNDKAYWHFFDNKAEFNTLFAEQVRRDWLDLRDATQNDLDAWVAAHGDVIGKPLEGSSGQGIVKYSQGRIPPLQDIRAQGIDLLEPCVVQHPALAALCPTSVNTLRIATLLGDKKQGVVYAYIRIGNGGVVDNVDQGGMAAPIDLETGTISGVGADKKGNRFQTHPMTGAVIPVRRFRTGKKRWICALPPRRWFRGCALWPGTSPSRPKAPCLSRAIPSPAMPSRSLPPTIPTASEFCRALRNSLICNL